jgi:hypothetical protein
MPNARTTLIAAVLGTALSIPAVFAAQSTDPSKQVTPPPTAGGNSAEPERTGKKPATPGVKESTPAPNRAQPSAGGNSAEPDKTKGGKGTPVTRPHDSKADPKYPSGGGNSVSKDAPARTSEKPERK